MNIEINRRIHIFVTKNHCEILYPIVSFENYIHKQSLRNEKHNILNNIDTENKQLIYQLLLIRV